MPIDGHNITSIDWKFEFYADYIMVWEFFLSKEGIFLWFNCLKIWKNEIDFSIPLNGFWLASRLKAGPIKVHDSMGKIRFV